MQSKMKDWFLKYRRQIWFLLGGLLFLSAPLILGVQLELITTDTTYLLWFAMRWNIAIIYLLELIVLLWTLSFRWSVIVTNVFLTIVYSVNYFVYSYRGVPLRPSDLSAIRTVAHVAGNYRFTPSSQMLKCWMLLLSFVILAGLCKEPFLKKDWRLRLLGAAVGGLVCVGGYSVFVQSDLLKDQGFVTNNEFIQTIHYNGYMVASCLTINSMHILAPEGYSVEAAEAILEEYTEAASEITEEELPHIILILNESFADLRVLGNLELSEENMPFFYSLSDNTICGYVNASVLGGGTANSEFEVLTGCSMGLLPETYYPYQQCLLEKIPSIVSMAEASGYTTYSVHPENRSNWNRSHIYSRLGFDSSLWLEDFQGAEILGNGVSDLETYYKIEELFANRQEYEKFFAFVITMQNHGGYTYLEMETPVRPLNAEYHDADIYLSLMKESDAAFKQLITYFEDQDEKVLICMFGDHQPKLGSEDFYNSIYAATEGLTEEQKLLNMYKTPFIIWANYDIEEKQDLDISMNYLGEVLLETAGVPRSPYFQFLSGLRQEYPIITVNGYVDADGNFSAWSGENTEFSEYRILQYNYLFDDLAEGF